MDLRLEQLVKSIEEMPARTAPWLRSWFAISAQERWLLVATIERIVRQTASRLGSEAPESRARFVERINACLPWLAGQTHPLFVDAQRALGVLREAMK